MQAVVIYESRTGNTARAARLVAAELEARGIAAPTYPVGAVDLNELAAADLVFVGTWVDGLIVAGHRPGGARKLRSLPVVDGKRVATFMTYAVHAGKALDRFARVLEERGATVVASTLLRRGQIDGGVAKFVADAVATVPA
jgi:flavodoxin